MIMITKKIIQNLQNLQKILKMKHLHLHFLIKKNNSINNLQIIYKQSKYNVINDVIKIHIIFIIPKLKLVLAFFNISS